MGRADFIAAQPSPIALSLTRAALTPILRGLGIVGVDYLAEDLERLRSLKSERLLIAPNHPTNTEPALLFHLSKVVDQEFRYLACREAFDSAGGLWGQWIRRLGAFSVVRGTADRASFRATREQLGTPAAKLVIFPEGEVYSQNDTLLPFHDGVFQLAFWALEDLREREPEGSIQILPLALKYVFAVDMRLPMQWSLGRLERFTGSSVPHSAEFYLRLRGVGMAMLRSLEREYRLPSPKNEELESDFTPRLNAVKEAILQRVALAAGVPDPRGETLPERMRVLIHALHTVTQDPPSEKTLYDTELRRQQRERSAPLLRDLDRIANWIAVYDGYVKENPSQERIADLLIRLERECFGKALLKGPRRCRIRLGEPLDLTQRLPDYQSHRRQTVRAVTREIETRIGGLLTTL